MSNSESFAQPVKINVTDGRRTKRATIERVDGELYVNLDDAVIDGRAKQVPEVTATIGEPFECSEGTFKIEVGQRSDWWTVYDALTVERVEPVVVDLREFEPAAVESESSIYGTAVGPRYGDAPRSIIGEIESTAAGNVAIRVGQENAPGVGTWHQTEHVVLTPAETLAVIAELMAALKPKAGGSIALGTTAGMTDDELGWQVAEECEVPGGYVVDDGEKWAYSIEVHPKPNIERAAGNPLTITYVVEVEVRDGENFTTRVQVTAGIDSYGAEDGESLLARFRSRNLDVDESQLEHLVRAMQKSADELDRVLTGYGLALRMIAEHEPKVITLHQTSPSVHTVVDELHVWNGVPINFRDDVPPGHVAGVDFGGMVG